MWRLSPVLFVKPNALLELVEKMSSLRIAVFFLIVSLLGAHTLSDTVHPRLESKGQTSVKNEDERTTEFWNSKAQAILANKLVDLKAKQPKVAKNIIMFLGDGMSVHTVTAARNFMSDSSAQVHFEKFPYFGLSKTYCVDKQVADSACTATAYLGGVKGNYGTIGVNAKVPRYHCTAGQNPANFVESIAKWAQDAGKYSGLVTTARVTHASPAGVYAHTANRDWEHDADIVKKGCSAEDNLDIARQLVEGNVGRRLNVIMGGGRQNFLSHLKRDDQGIPGLRADGRNLIKQWSADKKKQNSKAEYVWSKKGLGLVDLNATEHLLGLFCNTHCPYHGDLKRYHLTLATPSLTEMTEAALKLLQKSEKGYILFVEGARIDMAHHDTQARKSLEDTVEFANAVQRARNMTSEDDTLIVVTSDHSHTMTINGYANRNQKITGLTDQVGSDGLPYTVLSYANGPGSNSTYSDKSGRVPLTAADTENANFQYPATVSLGSETHGGDDVGVFASGPFAQYFSGNYEQSNIPALMAKAANIGPFATVNYRSRKFI